MNSPSSVLNSRHTSNSLAGLATAAQIAAALCRPVRSIRRALDTVPPDGRLVVNGNPAAAWLFASLPLELQQDLGSEAKRRGYASEEHLLVAPPSVWLPPRSLAELEATTLQEASDLQKALTPTLQRLQDNRLPASEIVELGLAEYRSIFGHGITRRHFDRLVKRTLDRDCGAENWTRLEIFLPERCPTKKTNVLTVGNGVAWQPVFTLVSGFSDPAQPSPKELCLFWDQAFACLESKIQSGTSEKRTRRELRKLIEARMPFVRASGRALEVTIRRRFDRWSAGGRTAAALADRRNENSGQSKAAIIPKEFRDRLLARAHNLDGRVAQAWRDAIKEGWMPADVAAAYPFDSEHKSYVPSAIRKALAGDLKILAPYRIGPHNAKMKGPHINRDYSGVPSGKIFQSDDITAPIWFYVTNDDGSFRLTRGQLLPWICARTQYIVTVQLIPEKGYDSIDILRGIARLHDEYGLPEELYFENGTWATQLIDGSKGDRVPWGDFKYGLSEVGIRIRHAQPRNPRAKIVENVGGQLQNQMNRLRGYAGRDPKSCPEATTRNLKLVLSGQAHPGEFFYSQLEWMSELTRICNEFNHEPQNGKMLAGLSPHEAFVKLREAPPVILPQELRYLLARSRIETTVKANGVRVNKFNYKGEAASPLIGRRVLAWFNAEDPESICLTDLDHKNPVTLQRESLVPAFDATPEEIEQAKRENHAQTKYPRTLYGSLTKDFPEEFLLAKRRLVIAPESAIRLGVGMNEQRETVNASARKNARLKTEGDSLARKVGISTNRQPPDETRVTALRELAAAGVKATNPYGEG